MLIFSNNNSNIKIWVDLVNINLPIMKKCFIRTNDNGCFSTIIIGSYRGIIGYKDILGIAGILY